MAEHKNCPNCAAPYDPALSKCPYCGTIYFDMSVIDFDHHEPFWLKIRVHGHEITQFVVPEMGEMTISRNPIYCDWSGAKKEMFYAPPDVTTDISFHAVAAPDTNIMATVSEVRRSI